MDRIILHCDLNNFFASVECVCRPELKGIPVAICGSVEERHGICLAKNELAKAAGVRTGDTVATVRRKCPEVVIAPPRYGEYERYSRAVNKIYARFTDGIEPFGCDESWLDVTGSTLLFGDGVTIANRIRETVKKETGLTISVGVSFNKIFAKLGSDLKKPDAVTPIFRSDFREIVWPLSVQMLLGVGAAASRALEKRCVRTVGQLAITPPQYLHAWLGKNGEQLWRYANGLDDAPVIPLEKAAPIQSISHGMTPRRDLMTDEEMTAFIRELTQEVGQRLRKYGMTASGVRVSVRDSNLCTRDFQTSLSMPTTHTETIADTAIRLYRQNYRWGVPVRSVSVGVFKLTDSNAPMQMSLLRDTADTVRESQLDGVMDSLRGRYGVHSIYSASYLRLLSENGGRMPVLDPRRVWNPGYSFGERGRGVLDGSG